MSEIYTVGINYRTAPQALRELIAVSVDSVADKLQYLTSRCRLQEAAIVSTCNRTEVYCLADTPQAVADWLDETGGGGGGQQHIYQLKAADAVRHLFRVASGLDSQLLGEPEIAGQVKQFAQLAQRSGFSGTVINRLMEHSLAAAKAVRSQTAIGKHSLSYPALALRTAAGIFPAVNEVSALFVGTGDMAVAGARIFADNGIKRLMIAGRDTAKAEKLAQRYDAEALPIARMPEVLHEFDVVVSSTGSQVPIIGKGAVESALRRRRHKPMMFADLALPRDLEPEIHQLPDVFVYQLDQFGAMAAQGNEKRQAAALEAERIIEAYSHKFFLWLAAHGSSAQVRDMRSVAEQISEEETAAALAMLNAGNAAAGVIEHLSRRLTARLMHAPTQCVRSGGNCTLHRFLGADKLIKDDAGTAKKIN